MMHQLNIRVDDELFRDLRKAYAREIEWRAGLPRSRHLAWSAFVRGCIRVGINGTADPSGTLAHSQAPADGGTASLPRLGPTRAERRRLEREHGWRT